MTFCPDGYVHLTDTGFSTLPERVEDCTFTVLATVKEAESIPVPSPYTDSSASVPRIMISPQFRFCIVIPAPYALTRVKEIVPTVEVSDEAIMIRSKVPPSTAGMERAPRVEPKAYLIGSEDRVGEILRPSAVVVVTSKE